MQREATYSNAIPNGHRYQSKVDGDKVLVVALPSTSGTTIVHDQPANQGGAVPNKDITKEHCDWAQERRGQVWLQ